MPPVHRFHDLDIDQDLAHERREWFLERLGWTGMAVVLLAAMAGLLGPGPLSNSVAGEPGSALWTEYRRFDRHHAQSVLRVHVGGTGAAGGRVRMRISRQFIDKAEISDVTPQPERVEAAVDHYTYVFATGSDRLTVTFDYQPQHLFGWLPVRIAVENGPELVFGQFLYP